MEKENIITHEKFTKIIFFTYLYIMNATGHILIVCNRAYIECIQYYSSKLNNFANVTSSDIG